MPRNTQKAMSRVSALTETTDRPVCFDDSEKSAMISADTSSICFDCLLDSGSESVGISGRFGNFLRSKEFSYRFATSKKESSLSKGTSQ